jgi:predicted ATP-dependent serine protease
MVGAVPALSGQEGTRPLLVEVQALVDYAHTPKPRRLSLGLAQNRLAMLLAVLYRHASVGVFDQDVFVSQSIEKAGRGHGRRGL